MLNPVIKSINRHVHIAYLYMSLALITLVSYSELKVLTGLWFETFRNLIGKGPIIWSITFLLIHLTLSRRKLINSTSSVNDVLFFILILSALFVFKDHYPSIVPVLLICATWFYATEQNNYTRVITSLFFLSFSLPLFKELTPFLQSMAVVVVETLMRQINIPVLVQEFYIAIPRGLFEVEWSCSGLGYLGNNLLLLFLYNLLSRFNIKQFILALVFTILISLVINWVRIFLIILVAHYWGFDVPFIVSGHQNFGWVVYVIFLVPFFYGFLKIDRMKFKPSYFALHGNESVIRIPSVLFMIPILLYAAF